MTARTPVATPLIDFITAAYALADEDRAALAEQITKQLTTVYLMTIQSQLNLYSCQKTATGPDTKAQRWIAEKAAADAESIVRTYNRELENRVQAIYAENKRGNRHFFASRLDQWAVKRNAYKLPSISLNTMTAAREYAQTRFVEENGIQGRWVFTGPPPVCKLCVRIKSLGPISFKETHLPQNRLPQHINCPHRWSQLIPKAIDCGEAWTG